jgi:hypothetical protein
MEGQAAWHRVSSPLSLRLAAYWRGLARSDPIGSIERLLQRWQFLLFHSGLDLIALAWLGMGGDGIPGSRCTVQTQSLSARSCRRGDLLIGELSIRQDR